MATVSLADVSKFHRPFICGLCMSGFDKIDLFCAHFEKHSDVVKKECFHVCDSSEFKQLSRQQVVIGSNLEMGSFTCTGCSFAFSTICQLHKHLSHDKSMSGSYIFDLKSSSAIPTLNECPEKKKSGRDKHESQVKRKRGSCKTDKGKNSSTDDTCKVATRSSSSSVSATNVDDIKDKESESQNLKFSSSSTNNISQNNMHCSSDAAETELTFMTSSDMLNEEAQRFFEHGKFLKCMVNFKTCKMFSDKECQVNIFSDTSEHLNIEVSETEIHNDIKCKRKGKEEVSDDNKTINAHIEIKKKLFREEIDAMMKSDTSQINSPVDTEPDIEADSLVNEDSDCIDDGDDDDDFNDHEIIASTPVAQDNKAKTASMNNQPNPKNDFIRKNVGKEMLLTCEICHKLFQQCFLIKHIENCHVDEDISDSFRKKLFDLTLFLQRKTKSKSTFYNEKLSDQVTENVPLKSPNHKPSTNYDITCKSKFPDLTIDKKTEGNNGTKRPKSTDPENKTDQNKKSSLKSVFRKIDKNCTAQAVKTSKKTYYPCKLCGVLIEKYKMKEHVMLHNTKRGKLLFSPKNLQECEKCGRVLRKGMFQNHVCLILTANNEVETETYTRPVVSKKPCQRTDVFAEALVSENQTDHESVTGRNNSSVKGYNIEMLSRNRSKVRDAITGGINEQLSEEKHSDSKLASSSTDDGRSCESESDKETNSGEHYDAEDSKLKVKPNMTDLITKSDSTDRIRNYFAERSQSSPKTYIKKRFVTCDQCGMFVKYDRLKTHYNLHNKHPKRFQNLAKCEHCERVFYRKNSLKSHDCLVSPFVTSKIYRKRQKKSPEETLFSKNANGSDTPTDGVNDASSGARHKKGKKDSKKESAVHRWICYECGKSFSKEKTFIRHRDKEHKVLVFLCHICMKILNSAAALEQHAKIHTVIRQEEPEKGKLQIKTARVKQASQSPKGTTSSSTKQSKVCGKVSEGHSAKQARVWIPGQAETDEAVQSIIVDNSHYDLITSQSQAISFANNTIDSSV